MCGMQRINEKGDRIRENFKAGFVIIYDYCVGRSAANSYDVVQDTSNPLKIKGFWHPPKRVNGLSQSFIDVLGGKHSAATSLQIRRYNYWAGLRGP